MSEPYRVYVREAKINNRSVFINSTKAKGIEYVHSRYINKLIRALENAPNYYTDKNNQSQEYVHWYDNERAETLAEIYEDR